MISSKTKNSLKRSVIRTLFIPRILSDLRFMNCRQEVFYLAGYAMEYVDNGTLEQLLNAKGALPETLYRSYFKQIITAIEYLHSREISLEMLTQRI